MKIKISLSYMILFSLSSICFSCDSTISPVYIVSGKVYGYNHSAVGNLKVSIEDQSVISSEDGSFSLNNITFPFDVTVTDEQNRYATIYKGISASNLSLRLNYNGNGYNFSNIFVTIPKSILKPGISGKIIFTDGNFVNSYKDIIPDEAETIVGLYINKDVRGKLIVLTYRKENGEIVSYENYGESPDMQIVPGSDYHYQFDSLDLMLSPGEQKVTGTMNYPDGLQSSLTGFYLSFSSKQLFNEYGMFSVISSDQFGYIIPTGLPRQYTTMTVNRSKGNTGVGTGGNSVEEFITNPSGDNNFEVKSFPLLITPEDKTENINNNTQFSFSEGSVSGLYIIYLLDRSRDVNYEVVTSERNFTLEGLEGLGLGSISNNNFFWLVQKIGPAGSMDDYVTNFSDRPGYFVLQSNGRTFSTAP